MSSLTLFEIASEYRNITNILMDSGCDEKTLADTLDAEAWELEVKVKNYGYVIRNLQATAKNILDAEIQMKHRRESIEKRADNLCDVLKTCMEIANVTNIDCDHFRISIQKNPPSVDIWDEKQIPQKFMRTPTPPPAPDKIAIKAAINSGEEVAGAKLVQGTKIVIK